MVLSGAVRSLRDEELSGDKGVMLAYSKSIVGAKHRFDVFDGASDEVSLAVVYFDVLWDPNSMHGEPTVIARDGLQR